MQTEHYWDQIILSDFHDLAERYGTPFFLYDADAINYRINRIQKSLEGLVKVFYAVKANPNLELLRAIRGVADGLDISSGGELEQAALAEFDMANLSFAGPAKTDVELATSIKKRIGCISIESMRELAKCIEIAKRLKTRANIAVRINPQFLNRFFGMKMGGKPIQFGIDEEEIDSALAIIADNLQDLDFQGIHIYAGSQCFEVDGMVENVKNALSIVERIETSTNLTCRMINLGGGFGISHGENGREMDVSALSTILVPMLKTFLDSSTMKREIIFELGRYLTADAGIYVTRVISSKQSRGKVFFMVDGGLHHHLAAAGMFGTALRSNYILKNISQPDAVSIHCNVAGPSCNPTDLLGVDVELSRPEQGDLVAVMKSGSYGFTASPLLFLGRNTPAELIKHNGRIFLGRRSMSMSDFN